MLINEVGGVGYLMVSVYWLGLHAEFWSPWWSLKETYWSSLL